MILIGSRAIKLWYQDFRIPVDCDYITVKDIENTHFSEYHKVPFGIYLLLKRNSKEMLEGNVLLPNALYTLKLSHLSWEGDNGKWGRHLSDAMWLKNKGCVLLPELYERLYSFWKSKFGGKDKIKFTKSPDEFFNDSLKREWDHDKLHEYFKVGDIPAYQKIIKNISESVLTDKEMFDILDHRTKLLTVLEEVFVVAFERNLSIADGYKHVVTRLSKGWWNTFALDNAEQIIKGFVEEKKEYSQKRIKLNKGDCNEFRKSV